MVYLVDLLLTDVADPGAAETLLRAQWLGIALTPPLYLEFVRAIRLSVLRDHFPRWLRPVSFGVGGLVAVLAFFTTLWSTVRCARWRQSSQVGAALYPFAVGFLRWDSGGFARPC